MLKHLLINILASSIVMKRNLNWHRQTLWISIPLFTIFMLIQTKYIIYQIKKGND